MKRKDKYKAKTAGSIMVSAILAIFVWIGIAQSMAIIANSGFKSIKSGRTAIQAQQYADISIDRLKNINYDELDTAGAHTRAVISGLSTTDWEDEVTIGAESTIAGSYDVKQRIATVNVYKTGDTLPRYTVEVPLSSQGNNSHKILDYSNKEFWGYYGSGNRSYTITAAADGILCGYLSVYVAQVNIYINDVRVGTMESNDKGGSVGSSFSHPIYKGDIIKIEGISSSGYSNNAILYFIPYK